MLGRFFWQNQTRRLTTCLVCGGLSAVLDWADTELERLAGRERNGVVAEIAGKHLGVGRGGEWRAGISEADDSACYQFSCGLAGHDGNAKLSDNERGGVRVCGNEIGNGRVFSQGFHDIGRFFSVSAHQRGCVYIASG